MYSSDVPDLPHIPVALRAGGACLYFNHEPETTWTEHDHQEVKVIVGFDASSVAAWWRTTPRASLVKKEIVGNSVTVIPAGQPHAMTWRQQAELLYFMLSPRSFAKAVPDETGTVLPELSAAYLVRDPLIEGVAAALRPELNSARPNRLLAESAATVLAAHLLRKYSVQPKAAQIVKRELPRHLLLRTVDYIEENLGTDLTLSELAKQSGISPHHFIELFRNSTGLTPHRFVLQRRIERSKKMLHHGQLSIASIALELGFSSQAHFATAFLRLVGTSPGRYRSGM